MLSRGKIHRSTRFDPTEISETPKHLLIIGLKISIWFEIFPKAINSLLLLSFNSIRFGRVW